MAAVMPTKSVVLQRGDDRRRRRRRRADRRGRTRAPTRITSSGTTRPPSFTGSTARGCKRASELEQRVAGDQQLPHHFRPARRRSRAAADEHQHQQHELRPVVPQLEVDTGKASRRDDRDDLEQRDADGVGDVLMSRRPGTRSGRTRRPDDDPAVGAELLVPPQVAGPAAQHAIVEREVCACQEHEDDARPIRPPGWRSP